ncbi:MAG TPA: HAMP domain-containing sensor histidine kinase [Vicinamibacterales bacterium]|nr:HAMP domain-containing sensor histidine kinase [Vicinamibacterales bacterium]
MSDRRVWYRSMYWRIALGYIAVLALLLIVQGGLAVWLTSRLWGRASRTPAQLAEIIAQDLSSQLTEQSDLDLNSYLRKHYGLGYQPFVVVVAGERQVFSNRPSAVPSSLGRDARHRLAGGDPDAGRIGPNGEHVHFAEYSYVMINGVRAAIVAVPRVRPPFSVGLREMAPTLGTAAVGLVAVGAALVALVIFRPTHRRLRSLEEAARALGEGRTDVRANESGGDEVSGLSATFNRMAADLHVRAAALDESDRARRQLLADVSHELMTPLAAIRGYVETLSMPEITLEKETRARYLDVARQETYKLEAIIGDLLDLARLEGGGDTLEQDEVLVDDLFRRVADRHRPELTERHVSLNSTIAPGTPRILGDADRLEQAVQNVAANAIRHTPEGGAVSLRAEPAGNFVRITVTDGGPGIAPEHLPHIFDRFYKADAARAGTRIPSGSGLGLSIVRAIVARHGGDVEASNAPEGGATFTLRLPAASGSAGDTVPRS